MQNKRLILVIAILLIISLSCALFGGGSAGSEGASPSGGDSVPGEEPQQNAPAPGGSGKYDTEFPIPPKVENFMDLGDGVINYQTPMKLDDVVEFYRDEFGKAGYEERPILTVIDEGTFSMVWDGHPSGEAIVVQGVDLGNGNTNVNVRFEDV